LVVTKENGGCLKTILSMKRFSKVKIFRVVRIKASCKELESISSSKVVNLRLSKCMLKGIQPNVLSKVVNSLDIVDFDHSRTNSFQLKCLLTSITEETKLKYLNLSNIDLSNVNPEILGEAVTNIHEVHLSMASQASLSTNQLKSIFERILHFQDSKLKVLNLERNVLYNVPSDLLAYGVNGLTKVNLSGVDIFREQIIEIFEVLANDTELKSLDVSETNLSNVRPKSLISSIMKLEELILMNVTISNDQFTSICEEICECTYNRSFSFNDSIIFYSISKTFVNGTVCDNL